MGKAHSDVRSRIRALPVGGPDPGQLFWVLPGRVQPPLMVVA
jgi:hypothetical protein